ncbi:class-II fumarase/aspartase family protein [Pseudooceanicola nitratireducens]|jgi:3-carboxy-cis,cis-muconate cycloisomerase|uniref:class-II fumarase/aspartase family protein n=1 Tax=Pseudooceanicola nitratireducens TaxID=517719 RepID=UPI001C96BF45|nr:adenylosuccinate lyase family protein [Pseudooceanicola nitratireducens]MBY6165527.1 adenylosuccinate lyase family protein [Pseudooceanicola nitratireducens]
MTHTLSPMTATDSPLFGTGFSSNEMRALFSPEAYVAHCVEVEVALARVQAKLGLIPDGAAMGIEAAAKTCSFDMDRLARETEIVGYPILPIVEQLSAHAGESGRYLHWGATTQDIMDSATVLQIRSALDLIETGLTTTCAALEDLAKTHCDTPMAGRTHMQHALPITFGYKAAVWLSGLRRHQQRLAELRPRILCVEFSGASGTLASLGKDGMNVQQALAEDLGLRQPDITWHSARDGISETLNLLAMIGGSLGKIAFDISIMMTTELAEVAEPFVRHRGASSTMPQKANPISCELILASARVLRQHAGLGLDAMIHDFERATGPWHLEWIAIPEAFGHCSAILGHATFMLSGLQVFPQNMRRNLDSTRGLIVAEAVMMALAPYTGRVPAHDLVYAGCRAAIEQRTSLFEVLLQSPDVTRHLDAKALQRLTEPSNYLGSAQDMVRRVLSK